MRALSYEYFQGPLTVNSLHDPIPKSDGVVIKVTASGLCRSDWHGWMGHDADIKRFPHVPGHELAGVVVEKGPSVNKFKIGDRVTVPFVCGCGTCNQCKSNNHQVCDNQTQPGFTHWGSFAEYVAIDYADTNLVLLPDNIKNETAAILGCRFVTSFRAVVDQAKVQKGQYLAIHGSGGVGLSAIMIGNALGARVIAVDINDDNLQLAKKIGAWKIISAKEEKNIAAHIKDITSGGAHVSIDALGSTETCTNSILSLRKRGKHIQVGLMAGDHKMPRIPMANVIAHELEIIGSHGMQAFRYSEMLDMIADGRMDPSQLISRTVSLEDAAVLLPRMNKFDSSGVAVITKF